VAVTAFLYGVPFKNLLDGTAPFDLNTDTIKAALAQSGYTPNQDTHDFFNDITNEASGTGYTAGGKTLTTPTVAYDTATNVIKFDADDVAWTGATFTARYAIVYKDTGTPSTSPLLFYVDFGGDQAVSSGTFTINWHANGLITLTVA
jgi:hypothetical protein